MESQVCCSALQCCAQFLKYELRRHQPAQKLHTVHFMPIYV